MQDIIEFFRRRPRPVPAPPPPPGDVAQALRDEHNRVRAQRGRPPLTLDARLCVAAQGHADRMAALRIMAHAGIGDGTPAGRITAVGYPWSACAENIELNPTTPAQAVDLWLGDAAHAANVLGPYVHLGAGLGRSGDGQEYWCCDYGSPT